jgi:hypothetical protein
VRRAHFALLACAACGDNLPDANPCIAAGGDGLDPAACLLPWPSSRFLVADKSTRTGFRIQIPTALMPANNHGVAVDPSAFVSGDGFSPMTTLFAELPAVLDASRLPTWHDPSASLAADSPTVIVDVDTGALVEHFDEVETAPDVADGTTELYIRPAARLAEGHHYAVGIRDVVDTSGRAIAATHVFAELRDRVETALPNERTAAFEHDVFAPLVAAGVARGSLVLAWDFRTASGESSWSELVALRDRALSAPLDCTITNVVEDATDPEIFARVEGTFGNPVGSATAPFLALVPRSAIAATAPVPLWIYGHGLFSDHTELARDFGRDTASLAGAVVVATDYTGLTLADEGNAASAFLELSTFPTIIARLQQGIVATLLLPRVFASKCAPQIAGMPALDPTNLGYFGNSMGGTLGFTIAALSPDVHRYAIGVGGMDFTVMMPRTHRWPQLEAFFLIAYPQRLVRDLLLVMAQTTWDLAESSTFGPHVLADPLPGSSVASVVLQIGLYDCDTTNIASQIAARTLGLTPVVYDLDAAPLPDATTLPPPVENGVHECVRRDARAQQQIAHFLPAGGGIVDTCGGACGPTAQSPACLAMFATP